MNYNFKVSMLRDSQENITTLVISNAAGTEELAVAERSDHTDNGGGVTYRWYAPELGDDRWYGPNIEQAVLGALHGACAVIDRRAENLGLR